jgi:hypothetical protein
VPECEADDEARDAECSQQGDGQAVALEHGPEEGGPGIGSVALSPETSQHLRHVHGEFVRRRILAIDIAGPAAVAEIG